VLAEVNELSGDVNELIAEGDSSRLIHQNEAQRFCICQSKLSKETKTKEAN